MVDFKEFASVLAPLVVVYSAPGCKHCIRAKNILSSKNIPFSTVDLGSEPNRREEMIVKSHGFCTVPQIFFNGVYIGGASKLEQLNEYAELEAMVEKLLEIPTEKRVHIKASEVEEEEFKQPLNEQLPRLKEALKKLKSIDVMNTIIWPSGKNIPAGVLAKQLRRYMFLLLDKYMCEGVMDYNNMVESEEWMKFLVLANELQDVQLSSLSVEERKAFLINVYNCMIFNGKAVFGNPSSLFIISSFNKYKWNIGGLVFSCNDVEHGLLRSKSNYFKPGDERAALAVPLDPRIHFALNCGAKSCPAVNTFSPQALDRELAFASAGFLEDDSNLLVTDQVKVSMILYWYWDDFASMVNHEEYKHASKEKKLLCWIWNNMGEGEKKQKVEQFLNENEKFKIATLKYDWSSNSKGEVKSMFANGCVIM